MIDQNKIAKHWQYKRLGEMFDFVGGGTPSKKQTNFWNGNISWASVKDVKGDYLNKTQDSITEKGLKNSASNIAEKGDVILITRISPGKSIIANVRTAINQDLKIAKPKFKTSSKFIHYFFNAIERDCIKQSSGTTVLGITLNNLNELKIPDLSFSEQQAIVSKIEELLSDMENGKQQLQTAQQQLKVYRQSLLKWAFEGKLSELGKEGLKDDRINVNGKKEILKSFNQKNPNSDKGELPKGWTISLLGDACQFSQGIQVDVKLQKEQKKEKQVKFLRIIDFTQGKDAPRYIDNPGSRYLVNKDEVSLVRYGASTGFVCTGLEGAIANNLFKVTPSENIFKKFLYYFLISPVFQNVIAQSVKGAAMPAISFGLINDVELPMPPLKEQERIVDELESKLTVCDKIEETISQSLQQAESLRQSILKRAFEGKLV